jgi:predicted DNA-binding ArsR family transcriptional regulator
MQTETRYQVEATDNRHGGTITGTRREFRTLDQAREYESDWHTPGECECPTDADYHAAYQQHLTANGYRLITWEEMD